MEATSGVVYINIHPQYSYATIILTGITGFNIKEEAKRFHIELGPGHKSIITGDNFISGSHLDYVNTFAKEMKKRGNVVLYRNERSEQWSTWP